MRNGFRFCVILFVVVFSLKSHANSPEPSASTYQLNEEEISNSQYIIGGAIGTGIGLGIGHAIQGRMGDAGWIFLVGELAAMGIVAASAADCLATSIGVYGDACSNNVGIIGGILAFYGFHIVEIVDLWVTPQRINQRIREQQQKTLTVYTGPNPQGTPMLGLTFKF